MGIIKEKTQFYSEKVSEKVIFTSRRQLVDLDHLLSLNF